MDRTNSANVTGNGRPPDVTKLVSRILQGIAITDSAPYWRHFDDSGSASYSNPMSVVLMTLAGSASLARRVW